MLKLQFRDRRQESVWLVDQVFTIGKNARNSLMLDGADIHDFHAELINERDTLFLVNKSAGATVWVNGTAIQEKTRVNAGDTITLGTLELELVDPKFHTNTKTTHNNSANWSLFSSASWLEKNHYSVADTLLIGRDPSCDVSLPLEHLSRHHCQLEVRNGSLYVSDLDSANGTFLNGVRIKDSVLKAGDKIKLDVITFEVKGPSHDPDKTIIRNVASAQASKIKPHQPPSPVPISPSAPPRSRRGHKIVPKNLLADGKQDWIAQSDKPYSRSKRTRPFIYFLLGIALALASASMLFLKS